MGKLITLDNTVCYLTPLLDGRVYVLPRRILDPELGPLATPLISTEYPIPDNQAAGHLRQGRWEKDFEDRKNASVYEEPIRRLMQDKMELKKNWGGVFVLTKKDFQNSVVNREAARQLVKFLDAFCWVSKKFEVECLTVGEDVDYAFCLREKKGFSIFSFGPDKGEVILTFRWSEFRSLEIRLWRHFILDTAVGGYRAWLNKDGVGTREENSALMMLSDVLEKSRR